MILPRHVCSHRVNVKRLEIRSTCQPSVSYCSSRVRCAGRHTLRVAAGAGSFAHARSRPAAQAELLSSSLLSPLPLAVTFVPVAPPDRTDPAASYVVTHQSHAAAYTCQKAYGTQPPTPFSKELFEKLAPSP
jgi:hypothetical protein